ncbi:hypothetical protein chiPu_0015871 [Chiloscyllium punctatum]|uniref:Receptor ligand binding region domain-containing protein n=1 Tax=Chiloscyllium punctatum TaxID=137246 RepID=A0A401T430_CHIPU|nr:hypothetical protein [Chiloscyllium punctatum]
MAGGGRELIPKAPVSNQNHGGVELEPFRATSVCKLQEHFISPGLTQDSDIIIGGMFPLSLYVNVPELHYRTKPNQLRCTGFDFRAFRWLQTMIFTIEEINKDPTILPNTTLGYRIYDTCDSYALRAAMSFLSDAGDEMSNSTCHGAASVAGIIGEAGSLQSSIIASSAGPFQVPIVSYFSTCTCLSDRRKYPTFFRTAPSDYFQTKALAQLVKHFGWSWIGALANDDDYGRFAIQQFIEQVTEFGACIAFSYILPKIYNAEKISQIVAVMKRSSAKVIVVFSPEREMLQLVQEIASQNVTGIQWLASEAWITGAVLYTEQFLPYLEGAIGFSFRRTEIPGLREFLLRVKPSPHEGGGYTNVFWEELFACKLKLPENTTKGSITRARLCTGSESLEDTDTIYSDTSQLRVSYNVYKGVYAIAHALNRLSLCESGNGPFINSSCASIHNFQPWQEVRFTDQFGGEVGFDENGDAIASYDMINCQRGTSGKVEYAQVGRFDSFAIAGQELSLNEHSIVWTGGKTQLCDRFSQSDLRWALTVVFAVEEINRNAELLPHMTLGYEIFDSCDAPSEALKGAFNLLKEKGESRPNSTCAGVPSVPVIVGDGASSQSIALSRLVAPFAIGLISYFSSCNCLSDKREFPNFFGTIPSDSVQIKALVKLVRHFKWNWVGVVAQDNDYGRFGMMAFIEEIAKFKTCVAFIEFISPVGTAERLPEVMVTI